MPDLQGKWGGGEQRGYNMTKSRVKITASLLAISSALLASQALAQTQTQAETQGQSQAPAQGQAPAPPAAESVGAVLVTATRRSESQAKVPVSVQVVTPEVIRQRGIFNVFSLQSQTPSLNVQGGSGDFQPRFSLRGLGETDFSPAAPPAVAFYSDDLFINSTFAQGGQFFDTNRIEVIAGPQGTLFGKNTTAGVIQVVSNAPTDTLQGYGIADFGDYNRRRFEGAVSGPLIDNVLDARVSFLSNDFDGYTYDPLQHKRFGGSDWTSGRIQLAWHPSANTNLTIKYEHDNLQANIGPGFQGIHAGGTDLFGYAGYGNPRIQSYMPLPTSHSYTDNVTAKLTHDFGNGLQLIDVAGYVKNVAYVYYDDNAAPEFGESALAYVNSSQYSNDFRIQSPASDRFSWMIGAFYLDEKLNVYGYFGDGFGGKTPVEGLYTAFTQDTQSVAGYGSATYRITDRLKLTGGIRYSFDKVSTEANSTFSTPSPTDYTNPFLATGVFQFFKGSGTINNSAPTGDATLSYTFDHGPMVYFRFANGYRAAEFNNLVFPGATLTHTMPETVFSYELGVKGTWFDGRLYADVAGFYYDFPNKQVDQILNGFQPIQSNASLTDKGIEINLIGRPVEHLEIGTSATFLDARWNKFPGAVVSTAVDVPGVTNLSGQPIPFAPDISANFYIQYEIPSSVGIWRLRTDWLYRSKDFSSAEFANVSRFTFPAGVVPSEVIKGEYQQAYWTGDVLVSLRPTDHVEVTAYIRNVTNQLYKNSSSFFGNTGAFTQDYAPPRTVGGMIEYRF